MSANVSSENPIGKERVDIIETARSILRCVFIALDREIDRDPVLLYASEAVAAAADLLEKLSHDMRDEEWNELLENISPP